MRILFNSELRGGRIASLADLSNAKLVHSTRNFVKVSDKMELDLLESILKPFERVTPPGAVPGTLVAHPEEPKPVIRVMAFSDGELIEETVEKLPRLRELTGKYPVTWIDVEGLGDTEIIGQLGEMYGLHRLSLEDAVNVHQIDAMSDDVHG